MAQTIKEVKLDVENVSAVLTRSPSGAGAPGETIVVTERGLQPLLGLGSSEPLRLGPALSMIDQTAGALTRAPLFAIAEGPGASQPGVCVLATKDALLSFEPSGALKLLAGQPGNPGYADGVGGAAQIASAAVMTAGANGDVWFSDGNRKHVRRASRQPGSGGGAAAAVVSTMRWEVPDYTLVHSLAYDAVQDTLYVLTPRSVYRVAAPANPNSRLELVAGSEEASGCVDGSGRAALFGSICDAVVEGGSGSGGGRLLVLDMEGPGGGAVVRVVDPRAGYAVSSLQPPLGDLGGHAGRLELLPATGELCVYEWGGSKLRLLPLPPRPAAAPPPQPQAAPAAGVAPAAKPAAASAEAASMKVLSEDWGAMLVTDPWNLYDVSIAVSGPRGERTFGAHSLILLARCEYLRFQINQQKARGVTGKFTIPLDQADAEAFWLLLRHIYTGRVDFPQHMVQPVLELAERLLMQRSADIIRTLLHDPHGGSGSGSSLQQQQQQAAAPPAAAAAAPAPAPVAAAATAYGAASAPSAPPPPAAAEASAPSAPGGYYGEAPAAQSAPPAPAPAAAAPAASAPASQQSDLPYPLAPFQAPVVPQQQPQQQAQQAPSGYGQPPAAGTASPYAYGAYGAPAAAPAAAQQPPYGYGAAPTASPYGSQPAPSPYGAPPATSTQTPYGAPPAASGPAVYSASSASSQSSYGAPPPAASQPSYGAPPQASAQAPYGGPPAQTPYGAPPAQTPYGAPQSGHQAPYGAPPAASVQTPYGQPPYGAPPPAQGYSPYGPPPPQQQQQQPPAGYPPYGGGYYPGQPR